MKCILLLLTIILLIPTRNAQAQCAEILSAFTENGWSTAIRASHWRERTHITEALSSPHPIYIESPYFDLNATYTGRIALRYSEGWVLRYVTSPPLKLVGNTGVGVDGKEVVRSFLTLSGVQDYELPQVHIVQKANRADTPRSSVLLVDNADTIVSTFAQLDSETFTPDIAVLAILEDGLLARSTWKVRGWNAAMKLITMPCHTEHKKSSALSNEEESP